jgi:medium-chain acyl-[acyl-carrier-protein] hydrolase
MEKPPSPPPNYSETYALRSVDCGADGTMRIDAIFEVLQEAAGYHADQCGAGFLELLPSGKTWILSRIRVDVLRPIRYRDVICVKTWPRGVQGIFALRDFRVTVEGGALAALGTSSWLLVDISSRRPLRVGEFLDERFTMTDEKVFGADAEKVPDFGSAMTGGRGTAFRVRPSDLDMNGHMTNTAYLKMLSDGLSETRPGFSPSSVTVNFMAEAFLGDELVLALPSGDGAGERGPGGAKLLSAATGKEYVRFALA